MSHECCEICRKHGKKLILEYIDKKINLFAGFFSEMTSRCTDGSTVGRYRSIYEQCQSLLTFKHEIGTYLSLACASYSPDNYLFFTAQIELFITSASP